MRTSTLLSGLLCGALALSNTGCIKKMLTNGQISATRNASGAFGTIGDYELARSAVSAGLVQFEGMHKLAPDNVDALMLLTRGWVGWGYGFAQDDMEVALDAGNEELAEYHKKRAKMAYDRAIFYGLEAMSHKAEGFEAAKKKDHETLTAWLKDNFTEPEDAELLFWTGYGWLARVNLMKDTPEIVADLWVGIAMLERSIELNPDMEHSSALVALAAYHARTGMAEIEESKKLFDKALEKTQRKALMVQLNYATRYACVKGDRALYEKMLNEVLQADDPDPDQRLTNTMAKRRAKRALTRDKMMDCGFDMSTPVKTGETPASNPPKG
jgi:tetratricopeptide (TPR) repeat protein